MDMGKVDTSGFSKAKMDKFNEVTSNGKYTDKWLPEDAYKSQQTSKFKPGGESKSGTMAARPGSR